MNVQETLDLFDSCWFQMKIFKNRSNLASSSNSKANPDENIEEIASSPRATPSIDKPLIGERSRIYDPSSPDTVLIPETIFSGKENAENRSTRRTRRTIRRGKSDKIISVSDLESEELEGFMDLGFVFAEEDMNSELVEILPGLQRFLGGQAKSTEISRPYLSESWDYHSDWRRRTEIGYSMVSDLRIFAKECSETDMKESLRWWARTIASNLRR